MITSVVRPRAKNIALKFLAKSPNQFLRFRYPSHMMLEPTNVCNLKCIFCVNPSGMTREKGFMSFDSFKHIIEDTFFIRKLDFVGYGEPLLNKDLSKMIQHAKRKEMTTSVSTNATILNLHISDLLESGLNNLIVCLDGATKRTHERYRVGSNFDAIVENIRLFAEERSKRKQATPSLILQFLVMKDNEQEIPQIVDLAKRIGVDQVKLKFVSLCFTPNQSLQEKLELARQYLPSEKYSRYVVDENGISVKSKPEFCHWIFRGTVVLWNGDVTACCYDHNGVCVVGNIFRDGGLKEMWNGERYRQLRQTVLRKKLDLCKDCEYTQHSLDFPVIKEG